MIFNISPRSSTHLILVPLLYLLLYGYLIIISGPFYLTRIDPDYVYLLNGMNCSIFNFDRIGHLDHPGTPFQLFLGWCIDLIYLFSGKESIVADVLSRPEHYLAWCSDILAVLLFMIMIWAGKIGEKHLGWSGAVILQLSPFFSPVMLDLSLRIMPDRFGFICVFVLMTTLIDAIYSKTNSHPKSSNLIWGILSGIIAAIKINFLPILFIPLILAKNKLKYFLGAILGFFMGILPIINRIGDFSDFASKTIMHDGIYGSGNRQFIDIEQFLSNLWLIVKTNSLLTITFGFVLLMTISASKNREKTNHQSLLFFVAFMVAVLISFLLVAKHYKNYYLAPILMTMGAAIFGISYELKGKFLRILLTALTILFAIHTIYKINSSVRSQVPVITARLALEKDIANQRIGRKYFIIKPEWLWGPAPEYGLIFGLSYVRHRDKYAERIQSLYPNVLSYEGSEKPFWNMRVSEVSDSSLLASGKEILILDQHGREATAIIELLQSRLGYSKIDSIQLSKTNILYNFASKDKKDK